MTINIQQKHIDKGVPCMAYSCPVALSLLEDGYKSVITGTRDIFFHKDGHHYRAEMPEDMCKWVENYDLHRSVQPATFQVSKISY
jgi:hypothetical protein